MKEGWEYKKLGEVCRIERGGSPRPIKDFITNSPDGLNWIKIGDTDPQGKYIYSTKEKIKPEGLRKSRWVEVDEFLLSNSMSFGRPYILKTNGCIHDGWLVLRDYQNSLIIDYFYYLLISPHVQNQFRTKAQGSTVSNLNTDRVADVNIAFPPLSEQQSIVDYLDSAFAKIDAMKANAEKALNEAKALFQASLKEMLEPKEGWEEKLLPEISENLDSIRKPVTKGKRTAGIYPYYGASGIVDYVDDYLFDEDLLCISEDGANLLMRTYPIAFPISGKVWVNNHAHVLRFKSIVTQKYVEYCFSGMKLDEYITGAAQPKLTQKALNSIIINLPSTLDEQQSIVATLDSLKLKVDRLQENYDKISQECDALKQAILRQVFE